MKFDMEFFRFALIGEAVYALRKDASVRLKDYREGSWAPVSLLLSVALGLGVFLIDMLSPSHGAIAVLYAVCILLIARNDRPGLLIVAGVACAGAAVLAFMYGHWGEPLGEGHVRLGVSLAAIAVATTLSYGVISTRRICLEQARILGLSHDCVIVLDQNDVVRAWNDGAEKIYGWCEREAVGRPYSELISVDRSRNGASDALKRLGQWTGDVTGTGKDKKPFAVSTRLLARRTIGGRSDGTIEASTDLSEQRRADAERQSSERRYKAIFDAAGFATWETDWAGVRQIIDEIDLKGMSLAEHLRNHPDTLRKIAATPYIQEGNQAAAELFGVSDRADLVGLNVVSRYPEQNAPALVNLFTALMSGQDLVEVETRISSLSGKLLDVVLRVRLIPEGKSWSRVLIMALDVTERNEVRAKLEQNRAELAHASRVSMLGQLTASIAHEVNQPLSAIATYGKSGRRWLNRPEPNLGEVANCLESIISNSERAGSVISRIRSLARKSTSQIEEIDLPNLINESISLIAHEASAAGISISVDYAPLANRVAGDRVQIQQVLVNLLINGLHAMQSTSSHPRELLIWTEDAAEQMVCVNVRDRGIGIAQLEPNRIFEPFFTTKTEGMGMGLSICRSIIESQGGRIAATNNPDCGATLMFTLPRSVALAE